VERPDVPVLLRRVRVGALRGAVSRSVAGRAEGAVANS